MATEARAGQLEASEGITLEHLILQCRASSESSPQSSSQPPSDPLCAHVSLPPPSGLRLFASSSGRIDANETTPLRRRGSALLEKLVCLYLIPQ
eukprot:151671-Rhodomonas_salina.1